MQRGGWVSGADPTQQKKLDKLAKTNSDATTFAKYARGEHWAERVEMAQ